MGAGRTFKYESVPPGDVSRGLSPVVGVVLLVIVTVGLAGIAGGAVLGSDTTEQPPRVHFTVSAQADADRITFTHDGGETVSTEKLTLRIEVDGEPLAQQPPVPFFAADGFVSGPTGPFNPAADPAWTAGESASIALASTNAPLLAPGSTVSVTIATDQGVITRLETEAA